MAVGYRYIGCCAEFLCERSVECRSDENQITVRRLRDHSPQLEHHGQLHELHAPTFWYQTLLVMLSPAFGLNRWYHAVTKSVCFSSLLYNNDGGDYADHLQPVQVLKNHLCRIHGLMIFDHIRTRFWGWGDIAILVAFQALDGSQLPMSFRMYAGQLGHVENVQCTGDVPCIVTIGTEPWQQLQKTFDVKLPVCPTC